MQAFTFALGVLIVASVAHAIPTAQAAGGKLLAQSLLAIAPSSASCDGATYPNECRTAEQAATAIQASFSTYGISHPSVQASLIALMAFESGEFKYAINHWPGVPNQGCRNMQSPSWNSAYSQNLNMTIEEVQMDDNPSFGAAAWFIVNVCPMSVRQQMWNAKNDAGWTAYMQCVGASGNMAQRAAYHGKALQLIGNS